MDRLPTVVVRPLQSHWRLASAFVGGGSPLSGEPQIRRVDGGGLWICTAVLLLRNGVARRAWEAMVMGWHTIDERLVVPRCGRVKVGGFELVTHSDGAPFSDGSLYAGGRVAAELEGSLALRATTATVRSSEPLRGGEAFTLVGDTYGDRVYSVARVTAVEGDLYTIRFGPPAREAYADGASVDFNDPRCVMRAQLGGDGLWPIDAPGMAQAEISFVETFRMD